MSSSSKTLHHMNSQFRTLLRKNTILQPQIISRSVHCHILNFQNTRHQLFKNNLKSIRYFSDPVITKTSWAKDALEKQGEKLAEPSADEKDKILVVTDEILENPSPKIKRLCIEILELNMVEVNALMFVLMVSDNSHSSV